MSAQITSPLIIPSTDNKRLLINLSQMTFFEYSREDGIINIGWITDVPESFSNIEKRSDALTAAAVMSAYKDTYSLIALPDISDYGCIVIRKDLLRSVTIKPRHGILLRSTLQDPTTPAACGTVGNSKSFYTKYNDTEVHSEQLIQTFASLMA